MYIVQFITADDFSPEASSYTSNITYPDYGRHAVRELSMSSVFL